jgi:large subunit ribosomal protein L25
MPVTLKVEVRSERGKQLAKARKEGKLPAIVYGPKEESQALFVDQRTFDKLFKDAGESTIITLMGLKEDTEVLVHDIAFDPIRGGVTHVDFYAIERGKELTVDVPLEYIGEAPAIKLGGTLTKVLHEVEVTCRPSKLPQHIVVDVSALVDFETQIHVKDIVVPEGVTITNDLEDVVALVQVVEEEVEEVPEVIDMDAIEVEAKGKKEEESPEGGEGEQAQGGG